MRGIVIQECGKIKEIHPGGLEVVCERAKVVFDGLIGVFGLAVSLWVEGSGKSKVGAKEGSKILPPG